MAPKSIEKDLNSQLNKTTAYSIPTKSTAKIGTAIHKLYGAAEKDGVDLVQEFVLDSGRRIDYLDKVSRTIYELKPNNARGIRAGMKQLSSYQSQLEATLGGKWNIKLDLY